jgi:glycosyltransferase involved in cell wall biosynthesis
MGILKVDSWVKKVLFYELPTQSIGGSKISLFNMVSGFDGTVQPIIFAHFPEFYQNQLKKQRVKIITPPIRNWPPTKQMEKLGRIGKSIIWWAVNSYLAFHLMRIIRKERIDIVHCNNEINANVPAIIASYLLRIPCVCHLRGFEPPFMETRPLFKKVSKFIAVSQYVKERYLDLGLVRDENCFVIYNGIDVNQFKNCNNMALRRKLGIEDSTFLIGMIGRPIAFKGHILFVRMAAIISKIISNVCFVIIGKVPDESDQGYVYYKKVLNIAKELNCINNLTFYEHEGEIAETMASLDVLALCSTVDNFGRVLFEAMAARVPVVSFDAGGVTEIVKDKENGVIIPSGDVEQMATTIISILTNKNLRDHLSTNGLTTAIQHFDRSVNAMKIAKIYDSLV